MAVVRAAAAAHQAEIWQVSTERAIEVAELNRVSIIKLGRRVQFGVTETGSICPDSADAFTHRAIEFPGEVRRVGAIHHVEQGTAASRGFRLGQSIMQWLT